MYDENVVWTTLEYFFSVKVDAISESYLLYANETFLNKAVSVYKTASRENSISI